MSSIMRPRLPRTITRAAFWLLLGSLVLIPIWIAVVERKVLEAVVVAVAYAGGFYVARSVRQIASNVSTLRRNHASLAERVRLILSQQTSSLLAPGGRIDSQPGSGAGTEVPGRKAVHVASYEANTAKSSTLVTDLGTQLDSAMSELRAPYRYDRVGILGPRETVMAATTRAPEEILDKIEWLQHLPGLREPGSAASYAAFIFEYHHLSELVREATADELRAVREFFWRQRRNCDYIVVSEPPVSPGAMHLGQVCGALGFAGAMQAQALYLRLV